jgi:hypothetical protein
MFALSNEIEISLFLRHNVPLTIGYVDLNMCNKHQGGKPNQHSK